MFKYVFFDLDGTLTDSGEGIIRSLEYAFDELKLEKPQREMLMKFIGPPLAVSFREFMHYDDETADKAITKYRERYVVRGIFENYPYDGIAQLLAKMKKHGFRLAVATTKPEFMAKRVTDRYELTDFFETVSGAIGDDDTKESVIRRACERMNIPESEFCSVLMVGDRKYDIIGAHACAIKCCGVKYGFAPEGELERYGADYIADDVEALGELIFSL